MNKTIFGVVVLAIGICVTGYAQTLSVTNGLTVQLKADGILYAGDLVSPVSDGSTVGIWENAGSAGAPGNAQNGSAGFQPTYHANVLNGLPVVRFDGINDYLGAASVSSLIGSSSWTTFAIFRAITMTDNNDVYGYNSQAIWGDSGSGYIGMPVEAYSGTPSVMAYTWNATASPKQTINLGQFTFAVASHSGLSNYIQSASAGSGNPGTVTSGPGADEPTTGALSVGKYGQTLDGDIAEILMYNRTLTSEEFDSVTAYLNEKYALGILPIPEPSTAILFAIAACAILRRRSNCA